MQLLHTTLFCWSVQYTSTVHQLVLLCCSILWLLIVWLWTAASLSFPQKNSPGMLAQEINHPHKNSVQPINTHCSEFWCTKIMVLILLQVCKQVIVISGANYLWMQAVHFWFQLQTNLFFTRRIDCLWLHWTFPQLAKADLPLQIYTVYVYCSMYTCKLWSITAVTMWSATISLKQTYL